jgi:hypothetical protein
MRSIQSSPISRAVRSFDLVACTACGWAQLESPTQGDLILTTSTLDPIEILGLAVSDGFHEIQSISQPHTIDSIGNTFPLSVR